MQALSLTVHIPIVCFGIAFPAMMLFVEGLYLRTGDATYKALAKRWSKVAVTLFAVGVVTGTILSFEFGLLWPEFMARFGEVFGIGFALEGISFFVEAIFIAIYVYGWDRLLEARALPDRHPGRALSGFAGSFNVIAVNGWMNDPTGFDLGPNGEVLNPQPVGGAAELEHVARADPHVPGGLPRLRVHRRGRLRVRVAEGAARHYHRTALVVTLAFASLVAPVQVIVGDWAGREVAERQPVKLAAMEGLQETTRGRAVHARRLLRRGARRGPLRDRGAEAALAAGQARPERDASQGLDSVPPEDRPPVNIVRYAFQTMAGIGTGPRAARRRRSSGPGAASAGCRASPWFFRAVMVAGPAGVRRADRGLDHDRGRPPAVDRLRGDAHRGGGHAGRRARGRLRRADRSSTSAWARRSSGCCGGSRASRRRPR